MAKLADASIQKKDIEKYLQNYSDFSFEIKVLKKLTSLGFTCEHSGTYEDPITKKIREFDIRAYKSTELGKNSIFKFCLSVECKNLRENFPLVVHCLPRVEAEAYQNVIDSHTPSDTSGLPDLPIKYNLTRYGFRIFLDKDDSVYKVDGPVGKSCDQVGKKAQNNELVGSDSDVFEKISQAINSTYDLIYESHYAGNRDRTVYSVVLPILVVPQKRLWTVVYDFDGNIVQDPKYASHVSYYIDKSWKIGDEQHEQPVWYYLSHLEIVELEGLEQMLNDHDNGTRFSYEKLRSYKYRKKAQK